MIMRNTETVIEYTEQNINEIFLTLEELFLTSGDLDGLLKEISREDLNELVESLSINFIKTENYEKCETIKNWKKILNNN